MYRGSADFNWETFTPNKVGKHRGMPSTGEYTGLNPKFFPHQMSFLQRPEARLKKLTKFTLVLTKPNAHRWGSNHAHCSAFSDRPVPCLFLFWMHEVDTTLHARVATRLWSRASAGNQRAQSLAQLLSSRTVSSATPYQLKPDTFPRCVMFEVTKNKNTDFFEDAFGKFMCFERNS